MGALLVGLRQEVVDETLDGVKRVQAGGGGEREGGHALPAFPSGAGIVVQCAGVTVASYPTRQCAEHAPAPSGFCVEGRSLAEHEQSSGAEASIRRIGRPQNNVNAPDHSSTLQRQISPGGVLFFEIAIIPAALLRCVCSAVGRARCALLPAPRCASFAVVETAAIPPSELRPFR